MPPPVFKKVKEEDVLKSIQAIIGEEKLKQLEQREASILKDFVSLAILMTDAEACYDSLAILNNRLIKKIESEKFVHHNITASGMQLAKKQGNEAGEVKHYGLLSGFFKVWEGMCGFNSAETISADAKGIVPTLTQFVSPVSEFCNHLFAPGYHWKDPGVGVRHGEFSHRVHWYMVIQEDTVRKFLANPPIKVFTMFADELSRGQGDSPSKTIWDAVFDKLGAQDFRQAETLHAWLKADAQLEDPKVGVLAQLVAGRSLKREHDKEKYDPEQKLGTDWYKEKLRQKEEAKTTTVVSRSDRGLIAWHKPSDFHPARDKVTWTEDDMKAKI